MSPKKQEAAPLVTVGGKKPKKKMTAAQRAKKRKIQKMIAGGVFLLLVVVIWFGMQPLQGTMDYGICRTYAELHANNPQGMRVISYENYGRAWKIFYTYTGQYGEQRSNIIDCTFGNDPQGQIIAHNIKINRTDITEEQLELFNKSIPAIVKGKPNLAIPRPLEETDLNGLRTIVEVEE